MSDITCDQQGLSCDNLLKLAVRCDENGNAFFVTDIGEANPLNIVTSCPCEFWFDGQDTATISLNVNKVIQWDDKSGNARHVANAVDAQRPTYSAVTGRLTFSAVNLTYLQCTAAAFGADMIQPNTIFILYKINIYINNSNVFDSADATKRNLIWMTGNNFSCYAGVALNNGATDANDNIHAAEFNGAASNYWINGVLVAGPGNVGAQNFDGITLGAHPNTLQQYSDVEIMEVFGYNCILTPAERTALDAYLTSKWGL